MTGINEAFHQDFYLQEKFLEIKWDLIKDLIVSIYGEAGYTKQYNQKAAGPTGLYLHFPK
jgi:hypothetical protein